MRIVLIALCAAPLAGLLDLLQAGDGAGLYGTMALTLLLGALGVPVPEEAVFAVAGALAAGGAAPLPAVFLVGWGVVFLLDLLLHGLGARIGPAIEGSRLGRRVGPARWAWLRRFVVRRGVGAVALARLVMGLRIPAFLLAGAMGMPRRHFAPTVAAVGVLTAAVPLALGYLLAPHLATVVRSLGMLRWLLLGVALVVLAAWWLRARRRP